MARTVLYGLSRSGEVMHSEQVPQTDEAQLRRLAEQQLARFHAVEVWVEAVRVLRLTRTAS